MDKKFNRGERVYFEKGFFTETKQLGEPNACFLRYMDRMPNGVQACEIEKTDGTLICDENELRSKDEGRKQWADYWKKTIDEARSRAVPQTKKQIAALIGIAPSTLAKRLALVEEILTPKKNDKGSIASGGNDARATENTPGGS